jgi:hypothetical protein
MVLAWNFLPWNRTAITMTDYGDAYRAGFLDAVEACAQLMDRWADDADARVPINICRNAATAIRRMTQDARPAEQDKEQSR